MQAGWRRYWIERRAELMALLLIGALAAGLRFWRLQTLPPGLHYDEAFNTLYALRIYRGEIYPIYIPENNGEEPLHIYLTAWLFRMIGPTPIGGRVVSAASGVMAVMLTYALGLELFRKLGRKKAARLGLLGSLSLALWYWPFHYSRLGMEPSMVPLVSALAVYFVWRAIRTRRKRDAVLAGGFTALGLYTYPAGRAIPLLVALVVAYHAVFVRDLDRQLFPNLWLGLGVAAVFFMPLGLYFVQHPDWLLLRSRQTTEVTLGSGHPVLAVWQGFAATLLGFFWRGDTNWRQNLPGRPMFDAAQFAFFLIGAFVCAQRTKASPYWFLLGWSALGLLPTILTEYAPHFGRALGATPPLALIIGLGMWTFTRQIVHARPTRGFTVTSMVAAAGLGLALAYSGGRALNDYFNRWARSPGLYIAFDVGLRAIGEYAVRLPPEEPLYFSPVPNDWYTLAYTMNDEGKRLRSFNGRECLVFPPRAEQRTHAIIIVQRGEDARSLARLQNLFPDGGIIWQTYNREFPYAVDYAIPSGESARFQPQFPRRADFNGEAELIGYDLSTSTLRPGKTLTVSAWWQALGPLPVDYTVFVHLLGAPRPDTGSPIWAQHDAQPCLRSYATTRWAANEIIWDDYRLNLPPDLPPGTYTLTIGMYDLATGERLPIRSADANFSGDSLTLKTIRVEASRNFHGQYCARCSR